MSGVVSGGYQIIASARDASGNVTEVSVTDLWGMVNKYFLPSKIKPAPALKVISPKAAPLLASQCPKATPESDEFQAQHTACEIVTNSVTGHPTLNLLDQGIPWLAELGSSVGDTLLGRTIKNIALIPFKTVNLLNNTLTNLTKRSPSNINGPVYINGTDVVVFQSTGSKSYFDQIKEKIQGVSNHLLTNANLIVKGTSYTEGKVITPDSGELPCWIHEKGVCAKELPDETPKPVCVAPKVEKDGVCVIPTPVCVLPQVLQGDVCVIPKPVCVAPKVEKDGVCVIPTPVCVLPQVLQGDVCVTPKPVCVAPKVEKDGVCVIPTPVCVLPQVLQGDVCVTPKPVCVAPKVEKDGVCVIPTPVCVLPQVLQGGVCITPTQQNCDFTNTDHQCIFGVTLGYIQSFNTRPIRNLKGNLVDKTDICTTWTVIGAPVEFSACSYANGGSGFTLVRNNGSPALICWSVMYKDGTKSEACNSSSPTGTYGASSCFSCGTKNRGVSGIILRKYKPI